MIKLAHQMEKSVIRSRKTCASSTHEGFTNGEIINIIQGNLILYIFHMSEIFFF